MFGVKTSWSLWKVRIIWVLSNQCFVPRSNQHFVWAGSSPATIHISSRFCLYWSSQSVAKWEVVPVGIHSWRSTGSPAYIWLLTSVLLWCLCYHPRTVDLLLTEAYSDPQLAFKLIWYNIGGTTPETTEIWTHIVAVITFYPCANQKMALPNLWQTTPRCLERRAPKFVCGLLKHVAVICPPPPPLPPPWVTVIRRGRVTEIAVTRPLLITITRGGGGGGGGGFTLKNIYISQLRALATHTPIWGRVAQGALDLCLQQIRKCHFFSDPCVFGCIF